MDLRRLKLIGKGAEARCYAATPRTVVKAYLLVEDRDAAWERQKQAYRLGIGPRTFGKLDKLVRGCYAYVSGRADVTAPISTEQKHQLYAKTKSLGWNVWDLWPSNVGVWRGRPVIIDFGELTLLDD